MATNIIDSGKEIPYTCTGNVASGALVKAGNMFGIAKSAGVNGDVIALATGVRGTLRKLDGASSSFAVGDNVYWDNTNSNCTVSATSNTRIGVATAAAANAATSVEVKLNGSF